MSNDLLGALARIAQQAELADEKTSTFRGELYGPSGGGKTTIAAMIMRTLIDVSAGDVIISIDTSEGYVSWKNIPGLSKGIVVLPFTGLDDVENIVDGIKTKAEVPEELRHLLGGIKSWDRVKGVILDEGSIMIEQDTFKALKDRHAGVYGDRLMQEAGELTDGTDSRITLERYRRIAYKLYDNRDIHVIITSHQREKKDKRGNIINLSPDFSPRISETVKRPLHLVAHLTGTTRTDPENPGVAVYTRVAQVHPTVMIDAKCRLNIKTTAVVADDLPFLIKTWLDMGGEQVKAEDIPRTEEVHTELIPAENEENEVEVESDSLDDVMIDAINK